MEMDLYLYCQVRLGVLSNKHVNWIPIGRLHVSRRLPIGSLCVARLPIGPRCVTRLPIGRRPDFHEDILSWSCYSISSSHPTGSIKCSLLTITFITVFTLTSAILYCTWLLSETIWKTFFLNDLWVQILPINFRWETENWIQSSSVVNTEHH
jgi:hypothetical protein